MNRCGLLLLAFFAGAGWAQDKLPQPGTRPLNVHIPHISTDKSIQYDYDIVYVRAKRAGVVAPYE